MPAEIGVGQAKKKTSLLDAIATAAEVTSAAKGLSDIGGQVSSLLQSPPQTPTLGAPGAVTDAIPEMQSTTGGSLADSMARNSLLRRAQLLSRGGTSRY